MFCVFLIYFFYLHMYLNMWYSVLFSLCE
uniref:Uncharacterized protein n=1 Tax=Rhizophora mucronata TaxID=61149 RepID=A0A2P2NHD2_RHIMU